MFWLGIIFVKKHIVCHPGRVVQGIWDIKNDHESSRFLGNVTTVQALVTFVFDGNRDLRFVLRDSDGIGLSAEVDVTHDNSIGQTHNRKAAGGIDVIWGGVDPDNG